MKAMVIGFPKSGTTTLTKALEASGFRPVHWQDDQGRFVGSLIYEAAQKGLDPFAYLTTYDVITQADVCLPALGLNFWPNLDLPLLKVIRCAYPRCLFILNYRHPEAICDSIVNWYNMQARLTVSEIPGLPPGVGGKHQDLIAWIQNHFEACRKYVAPNGPFLELDMEKDNAPDVLGEALGTPISGWGKFRADTKEPGPGWKHFVAAHGSKSKEGQA